MIFKILMFLVPFFSNLHASPAPDVNPLEIFMPAGVVSLLVLCGSFTADIPILDALRITLTVFYVVYNLVKLVILSKRYLVWLLDDQEPREAAKRGLINTLLFVFLLTLIFAYLYFIRHQLGVWWKGVSGLYRVFKAAKEAL